MKYEIYRHESIDSTNEEAKRLIDKGHESNFIIIANNQLNGKGRAGRNWESPKGNLYFTIGLRTVGENENLSDFCFIAGIALIESIKDCGIQNLTLKWPNDLMLGDKKLAGILIEFKKAFLIIGIGVNLSTNPMLDHSVSLSDYGIKLNTDTLLSSIMKNFESYYILRHEQGFSPIRKIWLNYCYKLNKEISFKYQGNLITGIFKNIDNTGNILIFSNDRLYTYNIGEIMTLL